MRFYKFLLPILLVLGIGTSVIAQHEWCGVTLEDQMMIKEQMFKNREDIGQVAQTRGAITYVRVQPHIVRLADGSGGIPESQVLESICIMNQFYNQIDVHFYLTDQGFKYINNSDAYTDPGSRSSYFRQRMARDAMNVFYVGSIESNGPGVTQAYYQTAFDFVVCDKEYALNDNVLPHEVGHYFTLSHPFFGWEREPWDEDAHGSPVGAYSPSGVLNEKMDSSNCQTAGDGICDTPPDYLFAFHPDQIGCTEWSGVCLDPDSTIVDPQEVNLMSYFEPCRDYILTEGQKTEVMRDLSSARRLDVRSGTPATLEPVTETPLMLQPVDDETVDGFEAVRFTWSAVPNAEWYMLEIDLSLFDFNSDFLKRVILRDTTAIVELTGRRRWKYQVKAFNAAFPCTDFGDEIGFSTGENPTTSVRSIKGLNDWRVMPNPAQSGRLINLQVNAGEAFDATIKIYDLVGKQVLVNQQAFGRGQTSLPISLANLTPGMYLVQLETEEGVATQKLIVN